MNTPPPVSTEDVIAHLWESVRAGAITWKDVDSLQAATMPLCTAHKQPCNVRIGSKPLCAKCIEEGLHRA